MKKTAFSMICYINTIFLIIVKHDYIQNNNIDDR